MFSEKMMDHCQNPRNVGKLDENDKNVGTGLVGSPVCGDMLQFWLKIENNIVVDAKFKTFGCGGAISSSSLMTEKIIEESVEQSDYVIEIDLKDVKPFSIKKIEFSYREGYNQTIDNIAKLKKVLKN